MRYVERSIRAVLGAHRTSADDVATSSKSIPHEYWTTARPTSPCAINARTSSIWDETRSSDKEGQLAIFVRRSDCPLVIHAGEARRFSSFKLTCNQLTGSVTVGA